VRSELIPPGFVSSEEVRSDISSQERASDLIPTTKTWGLGIS
jgi:hypothetical protein